MVFTFLFQTEARVCLKSKNNKTRANLAERIISKWSLIMQLHLYFKIVACVGLEFYL